MRDIRHDLETRFEQLGKEVKQFMDRITPESDCATFYPDVDQVEEDHHIRIFMDLPGIDKNDIQLSVKDNVLTIKGERFILYPESVKKVRQERNSGMFTRSFALPTSLNAGDIKAKFKDGVLTIEIPRTESSLEADQITIE